MCLIIKPDAVIHAAAEKRVEVVERNFEKANNLNVNATSHLAEVCGNFLTITCLINFFFAKISYKTWLNS